MTISLDMERAGRLIAKWKLSSNCVSAEDLASAAWTCAVGRRIAAHTMSVRLVRASLVVEVEDDVWRRQLYTLRTQILDKVEHVLGEGIVTAIEFRVPIPRREPQREEQARRAVVSAGTDEADRIQDPVMSRVYKAARKRASA